MEVIKKEEKGQKNKKLKLKLKEKGKENKKGRRQRKIEGVSIIKNKYGKKKE